MIEATFIDRRMDGVELYELLHKHRLLPKSMEDPAVCIAMAGSSDVGFLHEDDRVLAVILETHPSDNVIELIWVNEVSKLHQRKEDLANVAKSLRDRWFMAGNYERIGVHVPVARTQTIRTLKSLGFRLETLPWGIRSCQTYGNHMESMAVLSMLPGDPAKVYVPFEQKDTTLSNVG